MTPAITALDQAGIQYHLHTYVNEVAHGYGQEASAALNLSPAQVFKTLVVTHPGSTYAVALVPTTRQLDLKRLAQHLGQKKVSLAESADAERLTGYLKGGISPFGQKSRLPVWVHGSALSYTTVYVSGGRRGLEIEITPQALIAHCRARVAELCADSPEAITPGPQPIVPKQKRGFQK